MNRLKTIIPLGIALAGVSFTQAGTADDAALAFALPEGAAQELAVLDAQEMQQTRGAYGSRSLSINWGQEDHLVYRYSNGRLVTQNSRPSSSGYTTGGGSTLGAAASSSRPALGASRTYGGMRDSYRPRSVFSYPDPYPWNEPYRPTRPTIVPRIEITPIGR